MKIYQHKILGPNALGLLVQPGPFDTRGFTELVFHHLNELLNY